MQYRLLNDNCGVIITRSPEIFTGDLAIKFEGAPSGAVAIFEKGKESCYKAICNGACAVPEQMLDGNIDVSVVLYNGTAKPPRWVCESIITVRLADGTVLAYANDGNLPTVVANLRQANHKLREDLCGLEKQFAALEKKFSDLMEGYNII